MALSAYVKKKKKIVYKWFFFFFFDLQYDIINIYTHTRLYINVYRIRKGKANKTTLNRRKSM
jgi:predicted RNA-binding protein associated with RNAse of E/G family